MLKLYEATNGFTGFSYVRCYVIAENDERAKELASQQFKKSADGTRYSSSYWEDIEVKCMCNDVTNEFVSEVDE